MKNVLLIGGEGFIGSNLVKKLLIEDCKVSILGSTKRAPSMSNVKKYYGKLEDYDLIDKILINDSIDTVIHLASTLIPSSTLENFFNEVDQVIKPTIKLLSLFAVKNIKFVYFSSGGTIYGVNETGVFSESDSNEPISFYGQSKLFLEQSILMENRRLGLNFLIIRPSNPYGIGQNIFGKQGLIAASIGHILNGERIEIWGDGKVIRDYIHIDDLINATFKLLRSGVNNQVFNIGSGVGYSVLEIIDVLKRCTNIDFEVVFLKGRLVDVPFMILEIEKLKRIVGDNMISIEEGISRFYNYELNRKR